MTAEKTPTHEDGKTLLLAELFRRGIKQGREEAEREREEFRRRIRTEEAD